MGGLSDLGPWVSQVSTWRNKPELPAPVPFARRKPSAQGHLGRGLSRSTPVEAQESRSQRCHSALSRASCCPAASLPGAAALTVPGVCVAVTRTVLRPLEDLARLWETGRSVDGPPGSLAGVGERGVCVWPQEEQLALGRPQAHSPGSGGQASRPPHCPGRPSPSLTEGRRPGPQTEVALLH